MHKTISKSFG